MKVHGQCHCKQITFEAEIDPDKVAVCHCTDCQTFSGAPFRASVPAPAAQFRLLSGKPKVYVKTAESGNRRRQHFCGDCGTALAASDDSDNPATYGLRVGCLAERAQLTPVRASWRRSALPLSLDIRSLPGPERQS